MLYGVFERLIFGVSYLMFVPRFGSCDVFYVDFLDFFYLTVMNFFYLTVKISLTFSSYVLFSQDRLLSLTISYVIGQTAGKDLLYQLDFVPVLRVSFTGGLMYLGILYLILVCDFG